METGRIRLVVLSLWFTVKFLGRVIKTAFDTNKANIFLIDGKCARVDLHKFDFSYGGTRYRG